jgi:hypothetical protein
MPYARPTTPPRTASAPDLRRLNVSGRYVMDAYRRSFDRAALENVACSPCP